MTRMGHQEVAIVDRSERGYAYLTYRPGARLVTEQERAEIAAVRCQFRERERLRSSA